MSIFPIFAGLFMMTSLLIWRFQKTISPLQAKDTEDNEISSNKAGEYKKLLKNGKYMALLLSAFFFVGPALSHNTYFSFLYIETGGTIAGMGIVLLLMAISEAPIMAWTEKISAVLTTERVILIAMLVSAMRFLWYSTDPPHQAIAATFFLQGIANGIGIVEFVKYISKLAGTELISLAIPLFTALSSNCGAITCQLFGGIIVEGSGGWGVYLFYGILNLVGIIIYMAFGLHRPVLAPAAAPIP
jgi:PPP family 3-phenylpropionic acid transporter